MRLLTPDETDREEADRLLADVKLEHQFWSSDGTIIKNLNELHKAFTRMNEHTFNHHVNKQKNDFYAWVRDVHNDETLANKLKLAMTKQEMQQHIGKRIGELYRIKLQKSRLKEPKIIKAAGVETELKIAPRNIRGRVVKAKNIQQVKVKPIASVKSPNKLYGYRTSKPVIMYTSRKILHHSAHEFILGIIIGFIIAMLFGWV